MPWYRWGFYAWVFAITLGGLGYGIYELNAGAIAVFGVILLLVGWRFYNERASYQLMDFFAEHAGQEHSGDSAR